MARRPLAERIEELEQRGQQLEARRLALEARAKEEARRKRTRELIQIGGVMAALGVTTLADAQALQHYAESRPGWWAQWRSTT